MRLLLFVSAIALGVLASAVAADAQSTRGTRTPVPKATSQYPPSGYARRSTRVFPYSTNPNAYYDPHFDQYPEWAQKAFTPFPR